MRCLEDLDKDTVNFQPNYDDRETRADGSSGALPQRLVNGAGGIAVGMATNIPPHNLGEVIDACLAYIADPGHFDRTDHGGSSRSGFSDRGVDSRPRRHPLGDVQGPRLGHHARPREH